MGSRSLFADEKKSDLQPVPGLPAWPHTAARAHATGGDLPPGNTRRNSGTA